jgi:uncharacterized glyoxalase superfamily protein PhnB
MSKKVIPIVRLKDRHTLEWLVDAFGFTADEVTPDDRGGLLHAQLAFGEDFIMLSTVGSDDQPTGVSGMYLTVDTDAEVDDAYARALVVGAQSVREPADMPYGGRNMTVRDPEGNRWSVGSYKPGGAPQGKLTEQAESSAADGAPPPEGA